MKSLIFTLLIGLIIFGCSWHSAKTAKITVIPTQTDIQTMLVKAGYDIQVDGVIGQASREAWDNYIIEVKYAQDNN